jgi:hypothetical protein
MATARLETIIDLRDEVSKELQKIGINLDGVMKAAKTAAVAVGAAAIAAGTFAVAAAKQFADVGDAVEKMSKRTGLAAESVSALRVAADASGTSIETVEAAVKKMQITMADASKEGSGLGRVITKDIGVSLERFQAMKPDEQFAALGNAIASTKDPAQRAQKAFDAFGKAGTDLLPLFEGGQFSMAEWSKKAKELGVSFDDLSAGRAAQLNDALGYLKTAFQGIALTVGSAVAPTITKLVDDALPRFQVFAAWLGETLPQVLDILVASIRWLIDTATAAWRVLEDVGAVALIRAALEQLNATIQGTLVPAWRNLMAIVQQNKPVFEAMAQFLGAVVVVAILAVLGAIDLLVKMIAVWIDWTGKAITAWVNAKDNLKQIWEETKATAVAVWDGIKSAIVGTIDAVTQRIDSFLSKIKSAASTVSTSFANLGANLGFGGARAGGGPVTGGTAYLVGERGPELFVPGGSGSIVPNIGLAGAGGMTIYITGNSFLGNADQAAQALGDAIVKYAKRNIRL